MSDKFIIVIEADNKRAHAAYLKGLKDLEVIWPQIVAFCEEEHAENLAQYAEQQKIRDKKYTQLKQISDEYERQLTHWQNSSTWCRGPRPIGPYPCSIMDDIWAYFYASPTNNISKYLSIRAELQDMANLAGCAISSFRMTEYKVKEMIKWEDGSRIEEIKQECLKISKS